MNNNKLLNIMAVLVFLSIAAFSFFSPSMMGFLPFVLLASAPGNPKNNKNTKPSKKAAPSKEPNKSHHTVAREAMKKKDAVVEVEPGHYKVKVRTNDHHVYEDGDDVYCATCKNEEPEGDPYRACEIMAFMKIRQDDLDDYRAAHPFKESERDRTLYFEAWRNVPQHLIPLLRYMANRVRLPPREEGGRGRPPMDRRDLFFLAMVRQFFGNLSMPDCQPLFTMLYELGWVKSMPGLNIVQDFLKEPWIEDEIVHLNNELIRALAFDVEEVSIDGTGMSKWLSGVYRTRKWGGSSYAKDLAEDEVEVTAERNAMDALEDFENSKAFAGLRLAVCTETRIVVASVMDIKVLAETKSVPLLIQRMKQAGVRPDRVLADAAYAYSDIYDLFTDDLKAEFWTPMRDNLTKPKNAFMKRVYQLYWRDALAWYQVYKARSRVEGVIGAIKQRLSEHVASRNPTAIANEVQMRVLLWNLLRVLTVYHERGAQHAFMMHIDDVESARVKRMLKRLGIQGNAAA